MFRRQAGRRARGTTVAAVIAAALAPLAAAEPAAADEYTIYVCDADPPKGVPASDDAAVKAFPEPAALATRGMFPTRSGRRCSPGRGPRGLVTMNYYPKGGTAPLGARARYVTYAPGGTHIRRLRWAGTTARMDCRWTAQIYTRGPAGNVAIRNKRGVRSDCRGERRGQASGLTQMRPIPQATGATKFVQLVRCDGNKHSRRCSNRAANYAHTKAMEITIADSSRPGVATVQNTPFAQGAWVNSDQNLNYDAGDNVGVRTVQAVVAGIRAGDHDRDCDYRGRDGLVPCPNGQGTVGIQTNRLPEGTQPLALVATDSAGNSSWSGATTVRIDKTAPGAVAVGVAGGEGWRARNDYDLGWTNPDEGDRAPIVAANYRLCPAAGGRCVEGRREGHGIAKIDDLEVPAEGEWTLRMWRSDSAGNQQPENASQPVALRLDSSPPELGFERSAAEDPTLLAAQVSDRVSGLAGGQIEISRQGTGNWQQLATVAQGSRLVARVDDARLPAGTYQIRAIARDKAGNQTISDRRVDGQPMTVQLPLRTATALRAGVARRVTRRGKRRRRATVLRPEARVRFGRSVTIAGTLANADGQPLAGAEINLYSRTAASAEQLVGNVRTDRHGRYRYRARGSASRTLRVVYPGSPRILPAQREIALRVPAASTIRVRPRRTLNGRAVRFRGRLGGPFAGKFVELQAQLPDGRWRTFQTVRTGSTSVWRARYRFRETCGVRNFRFRARLPRQQGYPYETGRSRSVGVRVRGGPCRR